MTPGTTAHSRLMKILRTICPIAVALITAALFCGAVGDGHLHLDDWGYTFGWSPVAGGFSWANVRAIFSDFAHGGIYMPLTSLSYLADIALFGESWRGLHLTSVVIHIVNAALVWTLLVSLLRRLVGREDSVVRIFAVSAATLMWAIHPMRAEAVVWIASRKEELWTLFTLLASHAYLAFLDRRTALRFITAAALFVAAILSKPTAICFPLVAYALEVAHARRLRVRLAPYAVLAAISAVGAVIAWHSQTNPTGFASIDVTFAPWPWRVLNAAVSLGLYIFHTFWPVGIHIDYRAAIGAFPLDGAVGLAVLGASSLAVAAIAACFRRLRPTVAFSLVFFAATIMPVLGIFAFTGDKACADRYTYLPLVALALALAAVAELALCGRRRKSHVAAAAVAICCIAAESVALRPVVASLENDVTAYRAVIAADPDHWRALRTLGRHACTEASRRDEGVAMLERSLRLRPSQQTADALCYVLAFRNADGDFARVKYLGAAIARAPRRDREGLMLEALGIVAMRESRWSDAARHFERSLLAPSRSHTNVHALLNLGLALANSGDDENAEKVLSKLSSLERSPAVRARAEEARRAIAAGPRAVPFEWRE